ncbi:hypothetical protein GA0070216_10129 [Micromonospora matsumotoense]|uniref:Uncharacterized protein n=1 Tax=Micromonospora matsumotoense TaxID=121616 RepID=A0A1C4TWB5_9ACTN|nr:hypothetical protein [Micromonospora matsumotoense]SCE63733.1 hypothetical protein GA0070216_10129 [Micromonospora matsumotoense]
MIVLLRPIPAALVYRRGPPAPLKAIDKNRLKRIQYRTDLLDSFLAHTGLTLEPDPT